MSYSYAVAKDCLMMVSVTFGDVSSSDLECFGIGLFSRYRDVSKTALNVHGVYTLCKRCVYTTTVLQLTLQPHNSM